MHQRIILGLALLLGAATDASAVSYVVRDLGALDGNYASAFAVSGNGLVTGASGNSPFLYSSGGGMQEIPIPGTSGGGWGVNSSGQVAGIALVNNYYRGFLYQDGVVQLLPTLANGISGEARDINDSGQVTGYAATAFNSYEHAVIWSNGQVQDLGTLNNTIGSGAEGISNNGQVTGWSRVDDNPSAPIVHAFLYSNGVMKDLGAWLPGHAGYSYGYDVNDDGYVTGMARAASGQNHAFLYDGATLRDLGTLRAGNAGRSEGLAINGRGDVVGSAAAAAGMRAFLYSDGRMQDLNSLVTDFGGLAFLTDAYGINDRGDIVGIGYSSTDMSSYQSHAFIATVVPLPPALLLFATGLASLGSALRRRSR